MRALVQDFLRMLRKSLLPLLHRIGTLHCVKQCLGMRACCLRTTNEP